MKAIYTPKQAGKELGVSEDTVRRLIKANKLEADKFGRNYAISGTNLKAYKQGKGQ